MNGPRRIEIAGDAGWGGLGCAIPLALLGASAFTFASPRLGGWVIGSLFVAIAVLAACGRDRLIVDADVGRVVSWQGLLRPMRVRSRPFSDFDRVAIHCWSRGTPARLDHVVNLTTLSFPIRLEGAGDPVLLEFSHDYAKGRVRAEEIAQILGLPLEDDCRGIEAENLAPSELPAASKIAVYREAERSVFDLPAKPVDLGVGLRILASLGVPLTFLVLALVAPRIPERFPGENARGQVAFYLISMLTFPLASLPILWALSRRERVTLEPHLLRVEWTSRLGGGKRETGMKDGAELLIVASGSDTLRFLRLPGLALSARVADRALEFGTGLSREELGWLRREIETALGPRPTTSTPPAPTESIPAESPAPKQSWRPAMPPWPRK